MWYRVSLGTLSVDFQATCVVGRSVSCDIPVREDRAVSRRHARLEVTVDGVYVDDLRSKNGVWIDHERVDGRRRLAGPCVLQVGRTKIRFEPLASIDAGTRPSAPG